MIVKFVEFARSFIFTIGFNRLLNTTVFLVCEAFSGSDELMVNDIIVFLIFLVLTLSGFYSIYDTIVCI